MNNEPTVSVGIVNAYKIKFKLDGRFSAKGECVTGEQEAEYDDGGVRWKGNLYKELTFKPLEDKTRFSLYDVTIGINFHWERKETQLFTGDLRLIVYDGKLCAINNLPVEDYLTSVISSEMSASAPLEFLKAHAVISRSWLLAQIERRKKADAEGGERTFFSFVKSNDSLVRWYDREDHTMFDVCADDHCQRYQGITKAWNANVIKAVTSTTGEILMYDDEICDARFSKCCGGFTEEFETCWEDKHKDYLIARRDVSPTNKTQTDKSIDLTAESDMEAWVMSHPASFCNTKKSRILSQILNNYDQETTDFYRWKVQYTQDEIRKLISRKTKIDFGYIVDLTPLKRGKSGRISLLRIDGTKQSFTIGKELEIRRILSDSHLFSSAFTVRKTFDLTNKEGSAKIPSTFELIGAGWGHGVGLCQIGAAVMGNEGYKYNEILSHYYPGAEAVRKY